MAGADRGPVYWDASAIVTLIRREQHTARASRVARRPGTHMVSTLAYAEVMAVVTRSERRGLMAKGAWRLARELLHREPWQRLDLQPDRSEIEQLASKHSLRGADLWHLATVSTVRRSVEELRLLTFDAALRTAAQDLGFALAD
ncbi:MAG: type II toxin-antitoxin system VapC family toxin [Candidatus Dormibacteria bacterium]